MILYDEIAAHQPRAGLKQILLKTGEESTTKLYGITSVLP